MKDVALGFYRFRMKAPDREEDAVFEIRAPGISKKDVVRLVRAEWANLCAPGVSQNKIECLGWEETAPPDNGWRATKTRTPAPLTFWRPAAASALPAA